MSSALLVEPLELQAMLDADQCLVFDCRFDLQNPAGGRNSWLEAHVPGAVYAHLDDDLSSPAMPDTGRHPLPSPDAFSAFLGRSGWEPGKAVVAYDGGGGFIAARLWWLLKYFGLEGGGLLNGGLAAWQAQGLPLEKGAVKVEARPAPELVPHPEYVLDARQVAEGLAGSAICLLDARNGPRFRGEVEPLDRVAGHVPGARNHPCDANLQPDRRMRPVAELREMFRQSTGKDGAKPVIHMCGSGVTACHNLFAMELAGFENQRVYVGSWSEWIRDPARPIARGAAAE